MGKGRGNEVWQERWWADVPLEELSMYLIFVRIYHKCENMKIKHQIFLTLSCAAHIPPSSFLPSFFQHVFSCSSNPSSCHGDANSSSCSLCSVAFHGNCPECDPGSQHGVQPMVTHAHHLQLAAVVVVTVHRRVTTCCVVCVVPPLSLSPPQVCPLEP